MKQSPYFLGCPVWACSQWTGTLFTARARREDWLHQYSSVFDSVEGNSVFYALPTVDAVRRWVESTEAPFHFALKFPRSISHDHRLVGAEADTEAFLGVLHILKTADRLGPSMLQLPPGFAPHHLDDLAAYLQALPREFPYAVEVRHHDFFDSGKNETALNQVLSEVQADRVMFDSRPLFSDAPGDDSERTTQARKPQLPVRSRPIGRHPVIRLIGRNDVERVMPWVREWAPIVAGWIISGLTPYVFTHTPNELYAPRLARAFHEELRRHTHRVEPMSLWPGGSPSQQKRQRALF
jgi:uncharacterized protein YecE (DUF72 family)